MSERDFLDEMIDKYTASDPEFPRLLDAARRRRALLRALTEQRKDRGRLPNGGRGGHGDLAVLT